MELILTPYSRIVQLNDALRAIEPRNEAERKTLESAAALLCFQGGQLAAVNRRLDGDMSEIPDAALMALVLQRCPSLTTPAQALESTAMQLARDVRLVCFFRTMAEHSDEEPTP